MKPLIGMCVLGRPKTTEKVIDYIRAHNDRSSFQWAILDQDATPEVKEVIEEYKHEFDMVLHNKFNTGIVFGHNFLMSLRKPGQTYIKWDDDCVPETVDGIDMLLRALKEKDIGSALAKRPTFWIENAGRREFFNEVKIEERHPHFWFELMPRKQGLVGCVWAIKGTVLDKLGYFNEDTCCDDLDMPLRINMLNLDNVMLPDCVIKQNEYQLEDNPHPQAGLAKALYIKNVSKTQGYQSKYLKGEALYLGSRFDPGFMLTNSEYMTGSENNWKFCMRKKYHKGE